MTKIIYWKSKKLSLGFNGKIVHNIKEEVRQIVGAIKNTYLLEFVGIINSFENNFTPSDMGCKSPRTPTIEGPFLFWVRANIFLSIKVRYAVDIRIPKIVIIHLTTQ